jgi:hypothetical protein
VNVDFSGINLSEVEYEETAELLRQSAESAELIFNSAEIMPESES